MTLTADELDLLAEKIAAKIRPKMTLTSEDVAAELNCSRQYVDILRRQGKLRAIQKGKTYIYPRSYVEDYVESLGHSRRK